MLLLLFLIFQVFRQTPVCLFLERLLLQCAYEGQRTVCLGRLSSTLWSWILDSGHQAWCQVPLPAIP